MEDDDLNEGLKEELVKDLGAKEPCGSCEKDIFDWMLVNAVALVLLGTGGEQ